MFPRYFPLSFTVPRPIKVVLRLQSKTLWRTSSLSLSLVVPSACLLASDSQRTAAVASLLRWALPILFLPAASGFFYNADQSQTQPYDALFWKRKSVVIVRKRAEWPLPSWAGGRAGGMRWRAEVLQKQDGRSRLPLPFMSPMGVTQCSLLAFRLLCAPPLLSSLSLHHFVLFFFLSWPTPTHLQIPFFDFLTQLGGRASRTQRQDPSGTAEVDSGRLKDRGAEEITLFVHWMGTTEGTIAAFKQVAAAESISLA